MGKKLMTTALLLILLLSICCSVLIGTLKIAHADSTQGSSSTGDSDSWPMFRCDPTHSGFSSSSAMSTNQSQWQFTTHSSVQSAPAVAGGVVYVGSNDFDVYALNASTGSEIWSYPTYSPVTSSPAVINGVVYVGSSSGTFYALNSTTGLQIWSCQIGYSVGSSPTVVGGVVYIGGADEGENALNATTGSVIWSTPLGTVVSSAAVENDVVYVGAQNGTFYALAASTGDPIWSYFTGNAVNSSPAISDGIVYFGSYNGGVYALNATTGDLIWCYQTGGEVNSSPAVTNDVVYIGSDDGNVYAFNAITGSILWSQEVGGEVTVSPAVANGVVYIGSTNGNLYILNATSGSKLRNYDTGSTTSAAFADGLVYVGSADGDIYAFCTFGSLTSASCSPNPAFAGNEITCLATVSGDNPTGYITWKTNSSSGFFSSDQTSLIDGNCSTTFVDTKPGAVAITALYSGDADDAASNQTLVLNLFNATLPTTVSVVQSGTHNNSLTAAIGDQFNVDIRIDQVTNLEAYWLNINWSPNILQLENVTEGPFLKQGGNTLFFLAAIDNKDGYIKGGINDFLLSFYGVNGSGVLVTLTFQAIGIGNANITVGSSSELLGPLYYVGDLLTNSQISFDVINASVYVQSPVDFYHTGTVNFQDIIYFVDAYIQYYETGYLNPACDLNHDGTLNFLDLELFVQDYIAAG